MILQGGEGRHRSIHDGSDGGTLVLSGGKSYGAGFHDDGGSVKIAAGASLQGDGGNVSIASGSSDSKSSEFLDASVGPASLTLYIVVNDFDTVALTKFCRSKYLRWAS